MLEAKWTSPMSKGKRRWTKIRNVIIGVAQFRRAVRRRSISLYSNSGSEFDQISHASVDSYLDDHADKSSVEAVGVGAVSSSSASCKVVFGPEAGGATGQGVSGGGAAAPGKEGEGGGGGSAVVTSSATSVLDDRMSTGFLSRFCFFFVLHIHFLVRWIFWEGGVWLFFSFCFVGFCFFVFLTVETHSERSCFLNKTCMCVSVSACVCVCLYIYVYVCLYLCVLGRGYHDQCLI